MDEELKPEVECTGSENFNNIGATIVGVIIVLFALYGAADLTLSGYLKWFSSDRNDTAVDDTNKQFHNSEAADKYANMDPKTTKCSTGWTDAQIGDLQVTLYNCEKKRDSLSAEVEYVTKQKWYCIEQYEAAQAKRKCTKRGEFLWECPAGLETFRFDPK